MRKGLFLCFLYVLDIAKKGPFSKRSQWFARKRVFFEAKGSFFRVIFWCSKSAFLKMSVKGVCFYFGERSYVLPFACEWPDRGQYHLCSAYLGTTLPSHQGGGSS